MELPVNTLIIILIAVIVLIAVVVGIIMPAKSGGDAAGNRTDFTVICNGWAARGCGDSYYYENEGKINAAAGCSGLTDCQCKCQNGGFCNPDPKRRC